MCDERLENIEGTATGPYKIVSGIKLVLSLLVECLYIVPPDGEWDTLSVGTGLVAPEVELLKDLICSKEALKGGSSSGTGLNENGLDDICGVVKVGDTEDRVLKGTPVCLDITSHKVVSVGNPLNVVLLLCGRTFKFEGWSNIGEVRGGGDEKPTLYELE